MKKVMLEKLKMTIENVGDKGGGYPSFWGLYEPQYPFAKKELDKSIKQYGKKTDK